MCPRLNTRAGQARVLSFAFNRATAGYPQSPSKRCPATRVQCAVCLVAVSEVVLHGSQIRALVGEVVAAGLAEHVGPDPSKLPLLASQSHDIVDRVASELCLALRGSTHVRASWTGVREGLKTAGGAQGI